MFSRLARVGVARDNRGMTPPRHRRVALALALGLVVPTALGGGYGLYWTAAARGIERGIADWAAARRAEGVALDYRAIEISGFPFALVATLAAPRLALTRAANPKGGSAGAFRSWRWAAARLIARARPWSPNRVAVALPPESRIAVAGAGREGRATLRLDDGRAWIVIGARGAARVTVETGAALLDWGAGRARAARLSGAGARTPEGAVTLALEFAGIELPAALDGPLGRVVSRFALEATLPPPPPASDSADDLDAWRVAGGRVDIAALALDWGPLALEGRGTATLDSELRPEGRLDSRVSGWRPAIGAFVAAGRVKARDGALAATFLDLMARRDGDGRAVIAVALTARKGKLYLGPVAIARLAPLVRRSE